MTKKTTTKKSDPVKTAKPASKTVEGIDGVVVINIFSPGHEPTEKRVSIPHITGATNLLHRSPDYILDAVVDGLRTKYGERVN